MVLSHIQTTPATGAQAIFEWKELLKSSWGSSIIRSSGTGTSGTFNSTGDDITNGGTGTGGMARNNAWFRLRMPTNEEFIFQRGTNNVSWRIKHSRAGFTGGSPSATQVPSSTDEVILFGSGSDASPTFATFFSATDATYRFKAVVDNASPYLWWFGSFPIGGGVPNLAFVYDPLVATHPSDTYKSIIHFSNSGSAFVMSAITSETPAATNNVTHSYLPSASVGTYAHINGNTFRNVTGELGVSGGTGGIGANLINSKDEMLPIAYARRAAIANFCWKGIGTCMYQIGTVRSTGSVLDLGGGIYRLVMRDVSLPWTISTCEI